MNMKPQWRESRFVVTLWRRPIAEARGDGRVRVTNEGRAFLREEGLLHCESQVCTGVRRMIRNLESKYCESFDTDTGLRVTRVDGPSILDRLHTI